MKRIYGTPELRKIDFNYKEQIVAMSPPTDNPDCELHIEPVGPNNGICLTVIDNTKFCI